MDNISYLDKQWKSKKISKPKKSYKNQWKDYSHGCFIDFPDCLSTNNPMNHTEIKAKEDKPKKIST